MKDFFEGFANSNSFLVLLYHFIFKRLMCVCGPGAVKKVGYEEGTTATGRVIVTAEVQDIRVDGTFLFSLQPPPSSSSQSRYTKFL